MKYPTICAICRHPDRVAIERATTDEGMSLRAASRRFDVHYTQLWRHMNQHSPMGREVDPNGDYTCGEYARITDADRARVAAEVVAPPGLDPSQGPEIAREPQEGSALASRTSDAIQAVSGADVEAVERNEATHAEDPKPPRALESVRTLRHRIDRVMRDAEVLGNPDLILRAGREVRQTVELEARLSGEARESEASPTINVVLIKNFERTDAGPTVIEVGGEG